VAAAAGRLWRERAAAVAPAPESAATPPLKPVCPRGSVAGRSAAAALRMEFPPPSQWRSPPADAIAKL